MTATHRRNAAPGLSEHEMPRTYSNPRTEAQIDNWPSGGKKVIAKFWIETDPKRGQRACRATLQPKYNYSVKDHRELIRTAREPEFTKAKKLTYANVVRIVDGDNGKTYILALHHVHIKVTQGNFQYEEETVRTTDPRFRSLCALLGQDPQPLIDSWEAVRQRKAAP